MESSRVVRAGAERTPPEDVEARRPRRSWRGHTNLESEFAPFIIKYGYLALFLLVFVQELGVPNPITNEFVLLYAGYLAFAGVLNLTLVLFTVVLADCLGTALLYFVFFRFRERLLRRCSRWLPPPDQLEGIARRLLERQRWRIYVGRLMPFLRGYVSVAAGVLSVPPAVFLPAVVLSAITWSGGYVVAGALLGPYWTQAAERIGGVKTLVLLASVLAMMAVIGRILRRKPRQSS